MSLPQLLVIADDLTGATDTGIAFTNAGLETIVHLLPVTEPATHPCDVTVLSTHSRHLASDEAKSKVASALKPFHKKSNAPPWIYKKIDSTLRGHPGPELTATLEMLGQNRCLIAPAFPAQGRTTRNGIHYVGDMPLAETVFGQEVSTSHVADLFADLAPTYSHHHIGLETIRQNPANLSQLFRANNSAFFIADAATDADLQTLTDAAVAANMRLFCGSAGLANALTRTLKLQPNSATADVGIVHAVAHGQAQTLPLLVVAGTRNPQTARQIEQLIAHKNTRHLQPHSIAEPSAVNADLRAALQTLSNADVLVISTEGLELDGLEPQLIAQRIGILTRSILDETHGGDSYPQGVILTGGDTAMGTCMALGSAAIRLRGEVEVGVPYGELIDGPYAGLRLVTKAGGFGSDEVLIRSMEILRTEIL